MQKLKLGTKNLANENIQKLANIFPNVVKEGKVDFELLKQMLSDYLIDGCKERYGLNWVGKRESILRANTPINKTLRPVKEKSIDFENTKNLYIEGDNFEVLKIIQESYLNSIKMIYIDPPYNTGKDFIYKDNFKKSKVEYEKEIEAIDEEGVKLYKNTDSNGHFHSDWLSMMSERLLIARDLLKEDGVIFISIDDNEVHNLRHLCDEVFGEGNFVANVVWARKRGRDNSAKWFSKSHEYVLVYAKNKDKFVVNFLDLDEETKKAYKNPDNDSRGSYRLLAVWARGTQGGVEYDFTTKDGQYFSKRLWLFSKENLERMDKENKLVIKGDNIYRKLFLFENKGKIPETIWSDVSNAANASDEIKNIFEKIIFDTPKPIPFIKRILQISTSKNDIILDFFSGSATTAHAVMELNAEDGGERQFIMVQIPEIVDEKSEAYKAGYRTICDIGRERIIRAAEKVKSKKLKMKSDKEFDFGFRYFKVDSSNFKEPKDITEIDQTNLFEDIDNIKPDRNDLDLLFEVILNLGLELTLKIETKKILGKKVYFVEHNSLIACFDDEIDENLAKELAEHKPLKIVLKDSSFKTDSDKINFEETIKELSPETVIWVV